MGFFDDIQSQASELMGGATEAVGDAGANAGEMSADMQDQITQYAEEHNISFDAAREHFFGGNN